MDRSFLKNIFSKKSQKKYTQNNGKQLEESQHFQKKKENKEKSNKKIENKSKNTYIFYI